MASPYALGEGAAYRTCAMSRGATVHDPKMGRRLPDKSVITRHAVAGHILRGGTDVSPAGLWPSLRQAAQQGGGKHRRNSMQHPHRGHATASISCKAIHVNTPLDPHADQHAPCTSQNPCTHARARSCALRECFTWCQGGAIASSAGIASCALGVLHELMTLFFSCSLFLRCCLPPYLLRDTQTETHAPQQHLTRPNTRPPDQASSLQGAADSQNIRPPP